MYDKVNYPVSEMATQAIGANMQKMANPTMRENIDAKIQYHMDEIERLKTVKEKVPQLLDVNMRDLREAMSF